MSRVPTIEVGLTFWLHPTPNRRFKDQSHLFFVISVCDDEDDDPQCVVIVNISTHRSATDDRSCILTKDDHKEIKTDSFVYYAYAQAVSVATIEEWFEKGRASKKDYASEEVLKKIAKGASKTEHLENYLFDILEGRSYFDTD